VQVREAASLSPQQLARVLWAWATLGWRQSALLEAVAQQLLRLQPLAAADPAAQPAGRARWSPVLVGTVAWAFALLRAQHAGLMAALASAGAAHAHRLSLSALANLAWALARLGVRTGRRAGREGGALTASERESAEWAPVPVSGWPVCSCRTQASCAR
jgi:hypothetical protein